MLKIWNNKLYIILIIFILLNIFNLLTILEKNKNYFLKSSNTKILYWQNIETLSFGNYHNNILKSIIYLKDQNKNILINNSIYYYSLLMQKQIKNYKNFFNKYYFKLIKYDNKKNKYFKSILANNLASICNKKKFFIQSISINKNYLFNNKLLKIFINDSFLLLIKKYGYITKN